MKPTDHLAKAATRTLRALDLYRERHLVPAYFLTALADLRNALNAPTSTDEYTAFLETEAAKAKTGRCPNCEAVLRPLHCCACEGCDGCREAAVTPPPASVVAREATEEIREWLGLTGRVDGEALSEVAAIITRHFAAVPVGQENLQRRLFNECVTANWDPERKNTFAEEIAHLHEELSEAFRAWRRYKDCQIREVKGKLEGVPIEFADALIGMFYNAELHGFDLLAAIETKHQFNLTRNYAQEGRQLHAPATTSPTSETPVGIEPWAMRKNRS